MQKHPLQLFTASLFMSDDKFRPKLGEGELTEGLQAGLDELLPTPPLGQVSEGHGGLARCRLGRAGLVEPVRAARRRDPRPRCPSPSEHKSTGQVRGGRACCKDNASIFAYEDVVPTLYVRFTAQA